MVSWNSLKRMRIFVLNEGGSLLSGSQRRKGFFFAQALDPQDHGVVCACFLCSFIFWPIDCFFSSLNESVTTSRKTQAYMQIYAPLQLWLSSESSSGFGHAQWCPPSSLTHSWLHPPFWYLHSLISEETIAYNDNFIKNPPTDTWNSHT